MREFKFRAWDSSEKEMVEWGNLLNDSDNWLFELLSGENTEDILMQFTGLKDKNGIEIYEGDIIKRDNCEIGHVVYEGCCFILKRKNEQGCEWIDWATQYFVDCEVIGNIYENTELLKEK